MGGDVGSITVSGLFCGVVVDGVVVFNGRSSCSRRMPIAVVGIDDPSKERMFILFRHLLECPLHKE